MCFKLRCILSEQLEEISCRSLAMVLLCPAQDAGHPSVQCSHTVVATHSLVT